MPIDHGDSGGSVYTSSNGYNISGIVHGGQALANNIYQLVYTPIYYAIDAGFTVKTW